MRLKKLPLALLLAASAPALASAAIDTGATLPSVTVAGSAEAAYNPADTSAAKLDAPLRDIPQTVNVVPQALLRDQGAASLNDVLKSVPGIGLSHGDGQRDQVTIRGFTAIADQFIDGMRDDALYFRDLSNIEQVEVLKGPASVLYGRGSSGGMINRISRKPGADIGEATVRLSSHQGRRGEIDLGRKLGTAGAALRVTGAVERADSYRDQQFLEREALAPSAQLKLGRATSLLVQGEYLHDKRVTDFGIPSFQGRPADVPAATYYGSADAKAFDYSEARVNALGFTLDHRINERFTLRNAFRGYHYKLDRNNTLVGAVNEAAKTVSLTRGNVMRDEDGWFNQTELTQQATVGGLQHQVLYGVEVGRQHKDQLVRSQANAATVSLFNPRGATVPFTAGGAPTANSTAVMAVASAYMQDLATLAAHWKALLGLRHDRFAQETRERRAGQPSLARTDRAWSPRAGLVYQPAQDQSYYASFSKSFQPSGETFALAASNADLAPERTTNREVGARIDLFGGHATAGAALFRLERTNMKSTDPATGRVIPIGAQRTDGVELTLSGKLGAGWQVWSGYAWLDGRMLASIAKDDGQPVQGKRPTLTPEHSANLWLTRELGPQWGAGGGVSHVGGRYANPGNTVTLPGYTTAEAMAYYRTRALEVQLNVTNLFNRAYAGAGHGSSKHLILPGAPRAMQLTARYRF